MKNAELFMYKNLYMNLKEVLLQNNDDFDSKIRKIELLANFAWFYHPGLYVDVDIEKLIQELGEEVFNKFEQSRSDSFVKANKESKRIVHVASELYEVGGHTRLLTNVINHDQQSEHLVVLTRQDSDKASECIRSTKAQVVSVNGINSALDKAVQLREIVKQNADVVFLHIHPDDALALSALVFQLGIPIVLINHADHVFCLGTSLVDNVACIRNWSVHFTMERRCAKKASLLPILLEIRDNYTLTKEEARCVLGVAATDILLISVASAYKFAPNSQYNFFKLIKNIISKYDNIKIKIVGVSENDAELVKYIEDKNIELVGVVADPELYYRAADIYLDPMPLSSFTSLWEGCAYETAPVLAYAPMNVVAVDTEPVLKGVVRHAIDQVEWVHEVEKLILNAEIRDDIAKKVASNVRYYHAGEGWQEYYNKILQSETVLQNLHCNSVSFDINIDDINSAELSANTFAKDERFFLMFLEKSVDILSVSDLLYLFTNFIKVTKKYSQLSFYRYFSGIMKLKFSKVAKK
ncbi:glycosyltransferase family protein [Hymenobacter pini]|uniref:hypothetical protein n=1 Tax=Hymenobacter pini TaxID=2880879 RepID=UPI001CF24114|nr:hypothetical protein [Hymenobacter pini]MCA8833420.1 hypothetical protein [Hymenobacter pini]